MTTRQKKVQKHRRKREVHLRQLQQRETQKQKRMGTDGFPVYDCFANANWRECGQAAIYLGRKIAPGRITLASFLVDLWAMGLKDAWGRVDLPAAEFDELRSRVSSSTAIGSMNLDTARHLVFGGIDLARELGFRLPKRYDRWTAVLGPLPAGEQPNRGLFLKHGKILLLGSTEELQERLVGTTADKFLERHGLAYDPDDNSSEYLEEDGREDAFAEAVTRLNERLVDNVRKWCLVNGRRPHPLLPHAVLAMAAAIGEYFESVEVDEDDDLAELLDHSNSPEVRNEIWRRAAELLHEYESHGEPEVQAAFAQLQAYSNQSSTLESCIQLAQQDSSSEQG